jgi:hypothetical protein
LYTDLGVHLVQKKKENVDAWYENSYYNGFYGDAGIGYKFGFGSKSRLLVSTGYSYKNINRRYQLINNNCQGPPCYEDYLTYKNYLHRLSLKMGWQF